MPACLTSSSTAARHRLLHRHGPRRLPHHGRHPRHPAHPGWTPARQRHLHAATGKPVEVNALWVHGSPSFRARRGPSRCAAGLRHISEAAGRSFHLLVEDPGCRRRAGPREPAAPAPGPALRRQPARSPLSPSSRRASPRARGAFLTPGRPHARPRGPWRPGGGTLFERDAAYHNGTAWALMGYAAEHADGRVLPARARREGLPPAGRLPDGPCPGQLPEVSTATTPRTAPAPRRLHAQAQSVAEVLHYCGSAQGCLIRQSDSQEVAAAGGEGVMLVARVVEEEAPRLRRLRGAVPCVSGVDGGVSRRAIVGPARPSAGVDETFKFSGRRARSCTTA
jgi:hypothetical protein